MHIHFLNMLRPYSLCQLPHSHIKPHCILHQSAKTILPNNRVALRTPSDNHSLRYHIISSYNHDTTEHVILLKMHNIHNSSNSSRTKALTSMVTLPFPTILVSISSSFLVPTRTPFPAYPS